MDHAMYASLFRKDFVQCSTITQVDRMVPNAFTDDPLDPIEGRWIRVRKMIDLNDLSIPFLQQFNDRV